MTLQVLIVPSHANTHAVSTVCARLSLHPFECMVVLNAIGFMHTVTSLLAFYSVCIYTSTGVMPKPYPTDTLATTYCSKLQS